MKKILLSTVLLSAILSVEARSTTYEGKMKEALAAMGQCHTADDFKKVANTFDRIAKMETEEWLPIYYSANIKILLVYLDSAADLTQKDVYLDQVDQLISKMEEITNKNEAEVYVLKSFSIISRLGLEPTTRGQSLYPNYQAALAKAFALDANNPRVRYMQLSSEVGQAQWFGQDTTPFCPKLQDLYDSWDSFEPASDIHPAWGKDQVLQLMQSCN